MTTIEFKIFERIVHGDLRPHLKAFDSKKKIAALLKRESTLFTGVIDKDVSFLDNLKLPESEFKDGDRVRINIKENKKGIVEVLITNESSKNLDTLIDLDVPPPPGQKAEYFLYIIKKEFQTAEKACGLFLDAVSEEKELRVQPMKLIQKLKILGRDAHLYEKKLQVQGVDDFINPNTYIIHVLKTFIVRLILRIQEVFKPFLAIAPQSETELKCELYEYGLTLAKVQQMNESLKNRKMKYFIGDPDKGGKEVPYWKYLSESGLLDGLHEKGITINPTHNFELLLPVRKSLFEKAKQQLIADRNSNELKTSDFEVNSLYLMWLNNELKVIEQWLSHTYPKGEQKKIPPSNSDQIEIAKYRHFVSKEISVYEALLNKGVPTTPAAEKFKSLKNVFVESSNFQRSIAVLLSVDSPIIDKKMNYILGERQKGSIVAWIAVLRSKGFIQNVSDSDLSRLLNKQFKQLNLGIDGRTLRNTETTSYTKYCPQIKKLLN